MTIFYPDADPESTSVDGEARRFLDASSWASIHGGAGTASSDLDTNLIVVITSSATVNTWREIRRGIMLFDTSSLPVGATITSATLDLYITGVDTSLADFDSVICASTPASNTAVVSADYQQLGATDFSNRVLSSALTINAYNVWTLNAAGLTAINMTGITKLGILFAPDIDNIEPTYPGSRLSSTIGITSADNGTNKPKLTVTYTMPFVPKATII